MSTKAIPVELLYFWRGNVW